MEKRRVRRELARAVGLPAVPPPRVTALANRMRTGLRRRTSSAAPPPIAIMESMMAIYDNRVLGLLVSTGVAERLTGPMTAAELAAACDLDPDGLDRVLSYAAQRGFVDRSADGYRPSKVTSTLAADSPSWRSWVEFLGSDWFWSALRRLDVALDPEPASPIAAATGHEFFHFVNTVEPAAGRAFNEAMAVGSPVQALGLLLTLDWSGVTSVCDVGGGTGAVARILLDHLPGVEVTVLDLPDVVATIDNSGPGNDRLRVVGGSFFESVPPGLDRYLLLAIVHDWADAEAVKILSAVAEAMDSDARAIVVEAEIGRGGLDDFAAAADLMMLTLATGRERTLAQHRAVFEQAGLELERSHLLPSGFTAYQLRRTGV